MTSRLFEEALVDAAALKEAALKSAQQAVLEQHAPEVKKALKVILEQEALPDLDSEEDMGGLDTNSLPSLGAPASGIPGAVDTGADGPEPSDAAKGLPLAATEGEKLCACPDEEEEIEINFDELEKQMAASLGAGDELDTETDFQPTEPPINLKLEEELEIDEEIIRSIFESLDEEEKLEETELHLGESCETNHPEMTHQDWEEQQLKSKKMSKEESDEAKEDIVREVKLEETKEFKKALAKNKASSMNEAKQVKEKVLVLVQENKQLKSSSLALLEENKKIKNVVSKLKTHLEEASLSNARLLFTNRALTSDSLNERQKSKIVEAIGKAGSIDEVKLIFETLQNTVGSSNNRKDPKSLNEVVESGSGLSFSRHEQEKASNPVYNRWQKVAGIATAKK